MTRFNSVRKVGKLTLYLAMCTCTKDRKKKVKILRSECTILPALKEIIPENNTGKVKSKPKLRRIKGFKMCRYHFNNIRINGRTVRNAN